MYGLNLPYDTVLTERSEADQRD